MSASDNIKRLRTQRGWSQARLAIEAHVSQQAISFIERKRNEPSAEMIRALAKAFHVSPSEIIEETDDVSINYNFMENQLLEIFNQLNHTGKNSLLKVAESLLQDPSLREKESIKLGI